ncbi:MAG: AtpZ/AtpI family protein [Rubripirellula sp.]|nr:AtpZ/AtpI family protein [Rubripirellula sp.]
MSKQPRSKQSSPSGEASPSGTGQVEARAVRVAVDGRAGRSVGFRYAALGTELAACTLFFAGIGYAFDRARGHQKYYATAAGTLVGFAYGMFRFVSEVQRGSGGKS